MMQRIKTIASGRTSISSDPDGDCSTKRAKMDQESDRKNEVELHNSSIERGSTGLEHDMASASLEGIGYASRVPSIARSSKNQLHAGAYESKETMAYDFDEKMEPIPTPPPLQSSSSDAAFPLLLRRRRRRIFRRGGPISPLRHAAARFLRRPLARRMMLSSPSFLVRENAADQLEHRRNDWSYSKPVVALDVVLNLVLVGVALCAVVLSSIGDEDDDDVALIRVWVVGYGVGCMVHVACVVAECRERRRGRGRSDEELNVDSDEEDGGIQTSLLKHLESANTMFSCLWWIVGAYWVTSASPDLMHDSPEVYWVCISFLAFDVIFVALCVAITCLIGIAVCCFLPCIIAILYAMADQEGATQEEIEQLQKLKFRRIIDCEEVDGQNQASSGGIMSECDRNTPIEQILSPEDAECSICLCAYEDGSELRQLPCGHHFHSNCIDKWLFINAICPLCKFNILKPKIREEEV